MPKMQYFLKKLLPFTLGLVLFLTVQPLFAQGTGGIKGVVTDKSTKQPLFGANLIVKGTSLGDAANFDGNFIIRNIPAGKHTIVISYVGYTSITVEVEIEKDKIIDRNFSLEPVGIKGETVVVTAQAQGQLSAINQQLSSDKIINVVSAEKMQELPDANIAESIGRLPGISLQRNAGEAYAVTIRGLSPQYNQVSIEGVPMQSTNYYDRSIDLSLMSDNLVQGVQVSKTLTPDMDANALGGTVNITLRTAQPGLHYNFWGNGGYTNLNSSYDNYKFSGSFSDRFFNDKFGVLVQGNLEKKQLPSEQFSAGYATPIYSSATQQYSVQTQQTQLTDNSTERNRYGASLILDYASSFVDIKFFNFYDQKNDSNISRYNLTYFVSPHFYDQLFINETKTIQETHSLQALFKFAGTELPVSISYTKGKQEVPNGLEFDFYQSGIPAPSASSLIYGQPLNLLNAVGVLNPNSVNTTLYNMLANNTNLLSEQYDGQFDWKVPFELSNDFSGKLSTGGKYQLVNRESNNTQNYLYLLYGAGAGNRKNLINSFPYLNGLNSTLSAGIPASPFVDLGYTKTSILGYPIGPSFDIYKLADMQNTYFANNASTYWQSGPNDFNQDYSDKETTLAWYIMGEFNIGTKLIVVPGVRYQEESTDISAYHINVNVNNQNGLQTPPVYVDTKRDFAAWFPSINIKYKVDDHIQLLGAVYKSETLPSYGDINPLVELQANTNIVTGNPLLQPSTAWNYDLGATWSSNEVGLFSVDFFYKELSNLIYPLQNFYPFTSLGKTQYIIDVPSYIYQKLPGLSYYDTSFVKSITGSSLTGSIPINDPEKAYLRGIELSWQTHLWYLPGILSGLVLDLNASFMSSDQQYPSFQVAQTGGTKINPIYTISYQTVQAALQNQPKAIYNAILGWDYKGTSIRFSWRYQQTTLTSIDTKYGLENSYYGDVFLFDISLKQEIYNQLSFFANATNINNHIDSYYFSHPAFSSGTSTYSAGNLPTSGQTYSWNLQFGLTFSY